MTSQDDAKPKRRTKGGHPLFEKGNKIAIGNSGRPSKTDLPAMAKALDEWSKRDDALHLGEFSLEQDEYPQRLYEWRDKNPEFAECLKKARARIALRLRKRLHNKQNPYNYGLFMWEIGYYDQLIDNHHDQKEIFKANLKSKSDENTAPPQQSIIDSRQ